MEAALFVGAAAAYGFAAAVFLLRGNSSLSRLGAAYFAIDGAHGLAHGAGALSSDPVVAQAILNTLHIPSYAGILVGALFFSRFSGVHERFWWRPAPIAILALVPIGLTLGELALGSPYYFFSSEGPHAADGTHAHWMGLYAFVHLGFDAYFVYLAAAGVARAPRSSLASAPALLLAYALIREAPVVVEYATIPARWSWLPAFGLPAPPLLPALVPVLILVAVGFALSPLLLLLGRVEDPAARETGYAATAFAAMVVAVVAFGAASSVTFANMRVLFAILLLTYAALRHGILGARRVAAPRIEAALAVAGLGILFALFVTTFARAVPGWAAVTAGLASAPVATAFLLAASGLSPREIVRPIQAARGLQAGARVHRRYRVLRALDGRDPPRVALARDTASDRPVVLKLVPAAEMGHADARREADALAAIDDPNVVRLLDVAEIPEGVLLVLEHVEGGTLEERLRAHTPLEGEAFDRLAVGLLSGLAAIHRAGIVHRDVKPANILLTRAGEPKLADLHVARVADADATLAAGGLRSPLVGTLRYMSPEQARGRPATPATDVYAAALVLHEARTGSPMVPVRPGDTTFDVLQRVLAGAGPRLDPTDPLHAWFVRALAFDAVDRLSDATQALDAYVDQRRAVVSMARAKPDRSPDHPGGA